MLNENQRQIFNLIVNACFNNQQQLVFVYGHGGTCKTFLWKTILYTLRCQGKIVLVVASSGIASLLLPAGRTAHSRFKIPLDLTDTSSPMNDRQCFETLGRTLRDILDQPNYLFGGKTVMLGGDFRQTLPVKRGASRNEIIRSSIANSYLWPHFKIHHLTENMLLDNENLSEINRHRTAVFAEWLLDIGNGKIGTLDDSDPENTSWIDIPNEYCIPNDENGITNLIDFIYDDDTLHYPSAQKFQEKAIICPKNNVADVINTKILSLLTTTTRTYLSYDDDRGVKLLYPKEYLNSLSFPGLPPHRLTLKVGSPIMLLRNINIVGGLCNGTRLIVTQLLPKVIEARIITGTRINQKVFLPRIPLTVKDPRRPFIIKRKQFPVKVCYAMTINKAQGQSLKKIGIYLPEPVFGHGQLYVALSRATTPNGLKVLVNSGVNKSPNATKNIVYKDFLSQVDNQQVNVILQMATTSDPHNMAAAKGKMIAIEPEVSDIAALKPGDSNKIIEAIGTPIQANMDAKDTEYFDQLLELHAAYRIAGFNCEHTLPWERTLDNPTSLTFGKFISLQEIPNNDFPEHYFNFSSYNELPAKLHIRNPVLTDYIGYVQGVSEIRTSGNVTSNRIHRRIIDIQNLSENIIRLTLWHEMALNFNLREYEAMEKPVVIAVSSCWMPTSDKHDTYPENQRSALPEPTFTEHPEPIPLAKPLSPALSTTASNELNPQQDIISSSQQSPTKTPESVHPIKNQPEETPTDFVPFSAPQEDPHNPAHTDTSQSTPPQIQNPIEIQKSIQLVQPTRPSARKALFKDPATAACPDVGAVQFVGQKRLKDKTEQCGKPKDLLITFKELEKRRYVNGLVAYVDGFDIEQFSVHELNAVMEELGYVNDDPIYYHYMIPGTDLDIGLRALGNDLDVLGLAKYIKDNKLIMVYCEHIDTKPLPANANTTQNETVESIVQELLFMDYEFNPFEDNMTASMNDQPSMNEQEKYRDDNYEPVETLVEGETLTEDDDSNTKEGDKVKWVRHSNCGQQQDHEPIPGELDVIGNDYLYSGTNSKDDGIEKIRRNKLKEIKKANESADNIVFKHFFYVGQTFSTPAEVKERVRLHSIKTRRKLFLAKNDKLGIRAKCLGKIHVFTLDGEGPSNTKEAAPKKKTTKVKGKKDVGPSDPVGPNKKGSREIHACTSKFLYKGIVEQIEKDPDIPIRALQDELQKKYELGVSRMKAFKAKFAALNQVKGDYSQQYTMLMDYYLELRRANPDTTIKIEVERDSDTDLQTRVFKRIYVRY
ncbi:DNA helicase [Tanacetum coccineum]